MNKWAGPQKLLQRWMTGSRASMAIVVTGLLGALAGCTGSSPYEVDVPEPEAPQATRTAAPPAGAWAVKPGDTLYSIAFSTGTDWHALAAANGIGAPYTI